VVGRPNCKSTQSYSRIILLFGMILFLAAPAAARDPDAPPGAPAARARNPLEGYNVSLALPALTMTLEGRKARPAWTGPAVLLLDGRPAAEAELPTPPPVVLPRQPWDGRDWLRAGKYAGLAALLGGIAGALAAR